MEANFQKTELSARRNTLSAESRLVLMQMSFHEIESGHGSNVIIRNATQTSRKCERVL